MGKKYWERPDWVPAFIKITCGTKVDLGGKPSDAANSSTTDEEPEAG